jgi:hypothetical protein
MKLARTGTAALVALAFATISDAAKNPIVEPPWIRPAMLGETD